VSLGQLGLWALGVYLLALLALTEIARRARRDETPADHFLASRELGMFVLFLTLYATAYSGNSLLGYPGEAYRRGFSWVMATGFMLSIIVVFHALAPRLRPLAVRHGFVTPGDWVRHRFAGEPGAGALVRAVGLLMTVALANFLLAQLRAMGTVTSLVTDGAIPYWAGVVGLAAVILFYETRGGMRAVAWTDAAQGVLMVLGLAALLGWLVFEEGGLRELTRSVAAVRPDAVAVPTASERTNWFSTLVLMGVASVVYPQAIQRVYAARSGAALKRAFACMSFMPLITTLVVTLIGIAAIPRFRGLGGVQADAVMPLLLGEWAGEGGVATAAAALVFLGALAAIMSTADSCLLSLGSLLAGDLLDLPPGEARTTRWGKSLSGALIAAAVVLALFPRVTLWRLIELKMELLIQCAPCFLLALYWGGLRAGPALAGLALGSLLAAGAALSGVPRVAGVHVGVIGLGVNLALAAAGSLLRTGPPRGRATPRP
jgi:Na+/proline symporter